MKVLVLSCSTGGGHNSCARYIKDELSVNGIKAVFKDFYDIVNENAKELSSKIYLKTLGENGGVFKNVYKLGELYSRTKIKSPVYLINKLHKNKLYNFIVKNNFDLVIATHLFPSLTMTAINKDINYKKINFITVATDYEPCPFFEESKPNYFVIQKGLEEQFIKKGINKDILLNTGIPISTNFIKKAKSVRNRLHIDKEEIVILIMLGSMGFGRIEGIVSSLVEISNVKIIVVCGNNQKLYNQLKEKKYANLFVFGFVKNINDLIYSSDIVLSKPGGLSSTEIASFGKPLIHIFPIPGIETYNVKFFVKYGMSIECNNKDELISTIKKLIINKNLRIDIINNQYKYINRNSAKDLVDFIKLNFKN